MPDIFFNPYPSPVDDLNIGKEKFVAAATALYEISVQVGISYNPEVDMPIRAFTLIREDNSGVEYRLGDIIRHLDGRQREIARLFIQIFSRGQALTKEHLEICDDWVLTCLSAAAPVLEYALRNEGMAATIATEEEWETDFLYFAESEARLPNIWGQINLDHISAWVKDWNHAHLDSIARLEREFGVAICKGSMRSYSPAPSEWALVFKMLEKAAEAGFEHDDDQIKDVKQLTAGTLKQLRHLGSGMRIYVVNETPLLLGGFFKKGQGNLDAQNRAIEKAGKRVEYYWKNL